MIERIRFDGYRLLNGFEADLGKLTVVIGANATGKSTILEALSLISHAVEWPVEDVLTYRGGLISILHRSEDCREIGWEVSMAKPHTHPFWQHIPIETENGIVYDVRLRLDQIGKVVLVRECLRNAQPYPGYNSPLKLLDVKGDRSMIYDARAKHLRPFNEPSAQPHTGPESPSSSKASPTELPTPKVALLLSQMRFVNEYSVATWIRGYLASFCYYTGFDVSRDSPVRTKLAEIKPHTTLNWNGDNLGTVLHEILTRHDFRDAAGEFRDYLSAAYPHVDGISAETAYGGEPRVLVRIREKGLLRATEIWELSDGMLRFLLLCAALLNPIPPGLIAIDEPEAGLHPKLLPVVADMIRAASERSQVLVTTHSPELLNRFSLDEVAVLTRTASLARWTRPRDRASLRSMLEAEIGGTLGELHASGELEAIP